MKLIDLESELKRLHATAPEPFKQELARIISMVTDAINARLEGL